MNRTSADKIKDMVSKAVMRACQLKEEYWDAYQWRQRIKDADKNQVVHLEDCRRKVALEQFDRVVRYAIHLDDVIKRMLKIVKDRKGKPWQDTHKTKKGKTRKVELTPSILLGRLLKESEMCDPNE